MNPIDFGAIGDGVHDDTAAVQAANSAGDVCFPSGHTFLVSATGSGPAIIINQSNKHWQSGMIGGAAAALKQGPLPSSCSGSSANCFLAIVRANGLSVIGLNHITTTSGVFNEWDIGYYLQGNAGNSLFAGNSFSGFEGDAEIELAGTADGSGCSSGSTVAYNSFNSCGGYGLVIVAGTNNSINHNTTTDCGEGVEADNTVECTGGNLFDHETVNEPNGAFNNPNPTVLTGGAAAGANYSGNTVQNSVCSGAHGSIYESCVGSGCQPAKYINDQNINGCIIQ